MKQCIALAAAALAATTLFCGCASTPKRDLTRLQGTWVGEELDGPKGQCVMTIEGNTIKFQGTRQQEWYVGRLTLNPKTHPKQAIIDIADSGYRQYANQAARAIYKLKGDTLTIAGHEPGNEKVPTAFESNRATQTRAFVFQRQ